MAIGQVIGNLKVVIGADVDNFDRGMANVKSDLTSLGSFAVKGSAALLAVAAAAAAAGAAIAFNLTKSSLDAIDAQSRLAGMLGSTVKGIQALTRAAEYAEISQEALAKSASTLGARLVEAAQTGAGATADQLDRLGFSANELLSMELDVRFEAIADRMAELGYTSEQSAAALRDLGFKGNDFIDLFAGGGDLIRQAREEVERFGLAVSDVDAAAIENANDALSRIGLVMQGVGNQIAVKLAPYIEGIADAFTDAASSGEGFGETIDWVIEGVIWMIGGVADELHRTGITFKQIEAIGLAVASALSNAWMNTAKAINGVIAGLRGAYNQIAGFLKMPTIDPDDTGYSDWVKKVEADALQAGVSVAAANKALQIMAAQPLPSEQLGKWVEDVKAKSTEAAEAAVAARRAINGDEESDIPEGPDSPAAQAAGKRQEQLDAQFEQLRNSLLSEEQLEMESHATRLEQLYMFYEAGRTTEEEYRSLREAAEKQHQDKLTDIEAKAQQMRNRLQTESINRVVSTMGAISGAIEAGGNDQFGIVKGISIAMALLKGYESIVSSYAAGTAIGGPPVGIAFAAMAAATTAAQIAQIMSTGPSSSGTPTAAVSSGGGASSGPAGGSNYSSAGGDQRKTIDVRGLSPGQMFDGDSMRYLIEQLRDAQRDGWEINI